VNANHRDLCSSDEWSDYMRDELLPWVLGDRDLGEDVLEVGPGPGVTTELLRPRTKRLTAVEADLDAVEGLRQRFDDTSVTIVHADGAAMPFPTGRFSAAIALTMLHHVPTVAAQDALFAEVCRVLRPGGRLLGEDSTDDPGFREFHEGDVCVPLDPETLAGRLRTAGFADPEVELGDHVVRFAAVRP
jgi:SAM-dependent methyltransferase